MKKFDLTILSLSVLLLALVILGVSTSGEKHSAAVATVNGATVTQQQLYNAMKAKYGAKVLSTLTNDILIEQEGKNKGIIINDQDVQKQLKELKEKIGSVEDYQKYLERRNYTEGSLVAKMKQLMTVQKLAEAYNKEHNTKLDPNDYMVELAKTAQINIPDPTLKK